MKSRMVLLACVAIVSFGQVIAEDMATIESEVFHAEGTAQEIVGRAKGCIAQLVRFDAVGGTPAGDVIVADVPESGIVTANNRLPVKFWGVRTIIQSTLTVQAKDGRFRIRHSAMKADGLQPIRADSKNAEVADKELAALSGRIAACVTKKDSEW